MWKLFSARAQLLTRTQTMPVRTLSSLKWVCYEGLRSVKKEFVQRTWPLFCVFYVEVSWERLPPSEEKHFDLIRSRVLRFYSYEEYSSKRKFSMAASNTNPRVRSAKHEKDGKKTPENVFHPRQGQKSSSRAVVSGREDFFHHGGGSSIFFSLFLIHDTLRLTSTKTRQRRQILICRHSDFKMKGSEVLPGDSYLIHTFAINRNGIFSKHFTPDGSSNTKCHYCCQDRMFVIPRRKFSRQKRENYGRRYAVCE